MGLAEMESWKAGRASQARCSVGKCDHGRRGVACPVCRGRRTLPNDSTFGVHEVRPGELTSAFDHIRPSRARQQPAVRLRSRKQPLFGTVVDFARSVGKTAPCMGSTMVRSSGTIRTARPNITPMPVLLQDAPMDMANFHAVYANPRGKFDDGGDRSASFFPSAHTLPAGNPHAASRERRSSPACLSFSSQSSLRSAGKTLFGRKPT